MNKISKQLIKLSKHIQAGTWSIPDTKEKQDKLFKIVNKLKKGVFLDKNPIEQAIYHFIGDDDLFDKIDSHEKYFQKDIAELIIKKVGEFADEGYFDNDDEYQQYMEFYERLKR